MKILLSTIGSRGDVQPILGLALELQTLGHQTLMCAAPNFQTWVESFGVGFVPLGPDLEKWTRPSAEAPKAPPPPLTLEQRRELARGSVVEQFRVLTQAAQDCDGIVVAGVLQTAGRSVAEALRIPYVYAAYCPAALPSPDFPPAKMGPPDPPDLPAAENRRLWVENARSFNGMFLDAVNDQRALLRLEPAQDVTYHVATDHPMLAADPVLAPAGSPIDMHITQTGAWFLNDPTPLPEAVESFLAEGDPPLYLGFGSMRASEQTSRILVEAARAVGHRAIISQGWGGLGLIDDRKDCLLVGSVNHEKLLPRVAVVAHHGGAGTTTTAARAGKPQVIVPHLYDQYYWARRVEALGVGVSAPAAANLTVDALADALRQSLTPEATTCAQELARRVELHGARIAAEQISKTFG